VGGIRELVQNQINGFVVGANGQHEIAEVVSNLLRSPESIEPIALAARKQILDNFNGNKEALKLKEAFDRIYLLRKKL
jgi:glycosyltransferase involved in cell wall biosynthesis